MTAIKRPKLLIFDIDGTLIHTGHHFTQDAVRRALFDETLLTGFLRDSDYQIAIASFNRDNPYILPYGGRNLARTILDLQAPAGASANLVEDDFIQAWIFSQLEDINKHGKNVHIDNILKAYHQKYKCFPPQIVFYDDQLENCYLASKKIVSSGTGASTGVISFWCPEGVTRENITKLGTIGHKAIVKIPSMEKHRLFFVDTKPFHKFLVKYGDDIYALYLPINKQHAGLIFNEFYTLFKQKGITLTITAHDL